MDKKSKAQLFLERVEMIDAVVDGKLTEQRQWRELALNITANMGGEKVQSSGSQSKMADAVIKCIDMEDEIVRAVDKLIDEKKKVVGVLEKMDNPTWYKILHMRFVQYIELKDIAERLGKDYDWVTTNQGRAFKNVEKILEGQCL